MSEPKKNPKGPIFTSEDTLVVEFEGPGDNTRRPRRPNREGRTVWEGIPGSSVVFIRPCLPLVRLGAAPRPADLDPVTSFAHRVKGLTSKEPWVRSWSASKLPEFGPKAASAIPALVELLDDKDERVRNGAIYALENIGPLDTPRVIKALQDKRPRVRAAVAWMLGGTPYRRDGQAAFAALLEAVKDEDAEVRKWTAASLKNFPEGAERVVPLLIQMLKDPETEVRQMAARSLGELGQAARPALPALLDALKGKDPELRDWSVFALRELGPFDKRVVPALIEAMNDEKTRGSAILALSVFGPEAREAVPALTEALQDPNEKVRRWAEDALKKIQP